MGFFKKFFSKKDSTNSLSDQQIIAAGACPSCWGHSEYDGQFRKYVEDRTKSNINKDKQGQKTFVMQFVETNVTGIRLIKDGDFQSCPACKATY